MGGQEKQCLNRSHQGIGQLYFHTLAKSSLVIRHMLWGVSCQHADSLAGDSTCGDKCTEIGNTAHITYKLSNMHGGCALSKMIRTLSFTDVSKSTCCDTHAIYLMIKPFWLTLIEAYHPAPSPNLEPRLGEMGPEAPDMEIRIDITWIQFCNSATDERLWVKVCTNWRLLTRLHVHFECLQPKLQGLKRYQQA